MPAPKEPTSFDGHLGQLISNLARGKGGRPEIAKLLGVSLKTVDRRSVGDGAYTVRDVHLIADKLNTSYEELINMALRAYSGGSEEDGIRKLIDEEGLTLVSEPPASLDAHRDKKKTPKDMTDDELERERNAANDDQEHLEDEVDPA